MPTITDHLQQAREHTMLADEQPASRYPHAIGHLILALDNLAEALDKLHQQINALRTQQEVQR